MKYFFIVFTFLVVLPLTAQKKNDNYRLHIKRASGPIIVDGAGDDRAWQDAEEANDFFMVLPMDNRKANEPTCRWGGVGHGVDRRVAAAPHAVLVENRLGKLFCGIFTA